MMTGRENGGIRRRRRYLLWERGGETREGESLPKKSGVGSNAEKCGQLRSK